MAKSLDHGRSFSPPVVITPDAVTLDGGPDARRNCATARENGETYSGAGLAFTWSHDKAATFLDAHIAHDNTCECCRIAIAFAARGRPVVLFRNLFDLSVRDHAVMTFDGPDKPGPVFRVSDDEWAIDACPHHGPSLAVTHDGTYHVAWFTSGRVRKGLFYARSIDGGRSFSKPLAVGDPDHAPGRPDLLGLDGKLYLTWKEFDGDHTSVMTMVSLDNGQHWSTAKVIATTSEDSDHPILVRQGGHAFLSWQTQKEGYRLLEVENAS